MKQLKICTKTLVLDTLEVEEFPSLSLSVTLFMPFLFGIYQNTDGFSF